MKTSFNIDLVKIESCTILKNNNYDKIFWPTIMCFHPFISHEKIETFIFKNIIKWYDVILVILCYNFKK